MMDLVALWLLLQVLGMVLGFIAAIGIVIWVVVETIWKSRSR